MPETSIVIPTYNRAHIVSRAIESVLTQTLSDLEVLVIDDGSKDSTETVVKSIDDSRIRYFRKENGGPASARNFALPEVNGTYLAFLDSDDYWPGDYLEVMLSQLGRKQDFGAAYSPITLVHPDGTLTKSYKRPAGKSGWITCDLFRHAFVWPSAAIFRAEAWKDFFFDERLNKTSEDSDAFLRLSLATQFLFVPDVEAFHVLGQDSIALAEGVVCSRVLSLERFYDSLGGKRVIPARVARRRISHAFRTVAEDRRTKGAKSAALALYRRAIRRWPYDLRLYGAWLRTLALDSSTDPEPAWKPPEPLGKPIGPSRARR